MLRALFLGAVIALGIAVAPVANATPTTTTTAPAPTSGSGTYYKSCKEACAAGVAPIYKGQPGYRSGLDRDGDGIACEVCP
jgi:hypothetical protein